MKTWAEIRGSPQPNRIQGEVVRDIEELQELYRIDIEPFFDSHGTMTDLLVRLLMALHGKHCVAPFKKAKQRKAEVEEELFGSVNDNSDNSNNNYQVAKAVKSDPVLTESLKRAASFLWLTYQTCLVEIFERDIRKLQFNNYHSTRRELGPSQ